MGFERNSLNLDPIPELKLLTTTLHYRRGGILQTQQRTKEDMNM